MPFKTFDGNALSHFGCNLNFGSNGSLTGMTCRKYCREIRLVGCVAKANDMLASEADSNYISASYCMQQEIHVYF